MSFAVKRIDTGEYLDEEGYWTAYTPCLCNTREEAEVDLTAYRDKTLGLEIVELTEKTAPIAVSEAEAEMLKKAKDTTLWRPAAVISDYAYNTAKDSYQEALLEDRLMRAYVNGWTVEKTKRYLIKVPHTDDSYFYKIDDEYCNAGDSYHLEGMTDNKWFAAAEIEHYGLHDFEKLEVTDDEQ